MGPNDDVLKRLPRSTVVKRLDTRAPGTTIVSRIEAFREVLCREYGAKGQEPY